MENITLGQIASALAVIAAIGGGFSYLNNRLTEAINKAVEPIQKKLEQAEKKLLDIEKKQNGIEEIVYISLSHMATNNNTKEMQAVLDKYVKNIINN